MKTNHKYISIFLTITLLVGVMVNIIVYISFMVNQDYIAKVLCIEKEQQTGCNGKCELQKQIKKYNSPASNNPIENNKKLPFIKLVFFISQYDFILSKCFEYDSESKILSEDTFIHTLYYDVETPPPNYISFSA
ncbi:MAG: hypothetical protein HRT66_05970 [Flavobacteriaceae bacterium]|nr:hypothetical protein [Flavobacteriaceae bacterium]